MTEVKVDGVFSMFGDKPYFDEDKALAQLLLDGVLMSNGRKYVDVSLTGSGESFTIKDTDPPEICDETTVLFVICNDLFYWACADAEPLPYNQIETLYRMHMADKKWGSNKWCCLRRNLRPQVPVVEMMKADNVWDDEMEKLPAPEPS